ncbi:hypothetical protein [Roseovarius sp. D0-M9]
MNRTKSAVFALNLCEATTTALETMPNKRGSAQIELSPKGTAEKDFEIEF